MNITLEKTTSVSAVLTMKIEQSDYEPLVKDSLKKFCQKAQIPGFRQGKVPLGMAKKMYGAQARMEAVNKLLSEKMYEYIKEEKINMLGEPMSHEGQETQDIEKQDNFEFKFDVALAPDFSVELTDKDQVDYYTIEVTDAEVNSQLDELTRQAGAPEETEEYREGDIIRGTLAELENGAIKENGLVLEKVSLMPNYFKNEDQKKLFEAAKKNQVVTFNPFTAYDGNETELAAMLKIDKTAVADYKGDFSYEITEVSRFVPATLNQEFYDKVFGKDAVKSEEECRNKIKEQIQLQHDSNADYKFLLDVRSYAEKKVGDLEFDNALLKRIMLSNNKDKDEKFVDDNFDKSIEELKWHLIKEKLVAANNIKIEDKDVKEMAIQAARFQFAQYGINNIPDNYLEQYASEMLKKQDQVNSLVERCIDDRLIKALKEIVALNKKSISMDDFQKLFDEKK